MGHLGIVLYEYLGEEYPEVLGSILGALKGIVNVIGMTKMTPPIKDLLPRLTPILKNRYKFICTSFICQLLTYILYMYGKFYVLFSNHTCIVIKLSSVQLFHLHNCFGL